MRLITTLLFCGLLAYTPRAQAAIPTLSGLADSLTSLQERYVNLTNRLEETRTALAEANVRISSATTIIARVKAVIEGRKELREAFHGGLLGTYYYTVTNGVGPSGRQRVTQILIDLYADNTVHTNAPMIRLVALKDPEEAARLRAEEARKQEELRRAWEEANLPPDLAALRAAQRANTVTQEVSVVVEGN